MNSLLPFRKAVHFRAGRGAHEGGKRKEGAVGNRWKPAEIGAQGAEMWIELEVKLVADVGVPNAGKSTLLSAVSAAKPEIANYPFTTLLPNLGVVALDNNATMVVADLPGLLEGAHTGIVLGHEFLRHTERCTILVHVIDGMSSQPVEELEAGRLQLQLFNPILSERWDDFQRRLQCNGIKPLSMIAATGQGSSQVMLAAHALLKEQTESSLADYTEEEPKTMAVAEMVRKQRSAPIEDFRIAEDKHTRTWQVIAAGLERFTQMTNWENATPIPPDGILTRLTVGHSLAFSKGPKRPQVFGLATDQMGQADSSQWTDGKPTLYTTLLIHGSS